jgi:hypothetical protein
LKVLEIYKKLLGESNVIYGITLGKLAGILRNLGIYKESKEKYK